MDQFEEQAAANAAKHQFLDDITRSALERLQQIVDDPETPHGVRAKAVVDLARLAEKERARTGSTSVVDLRISAEREEFFRNIGSRS